jgi:hypothetical protein
LSEISSSSSSSSGSSFGFFFESLTSEIIQSFFAGSKLKNLLHPENEHFRP